MALGSPWWEIDRAPNTPTFQDLYSEFSLESQNWELVHSERVSLDGRCLNPEVRLERTGLLNSTTSKDL
jgi:hypothetical protein